MPFSSGLSPSGAAGRVQMSPRGPRSASGPEDYETESKFHGTMAKLKQGCDVFLPAVARLSPARRRKARAAAARSPALQIQSVANISPSSI